MAVLREPERDEDGEIVLNGKGEPVMIPTDFEEEGSEVEKVFLVMRAKADKDPTAPKVKAEMEILQAGAENKGKVRYKWIATDTDTADEFNTEFEKVFEDGSTETVPNKSYDEIVVEDDLG